MIKFEQDFFDELGRGLLKTEYSDRLRKELEDHIEDATYMKLTTGTREERARQEAVEELGPAKDVRQTFNTAMRMRQAFNVYLEAIFVAVISIPVLLIVNAAVPAIPFILMEPGAWPASILPILLVLIVLPLFYFLTIPRLFRYTDGQREKLLICAITLTPSVLSVLARSWGAFGDLLLQDTPMVAFQFLAIAFVIPLGFDLVSFLLAAILFRRALARQLARPEKIRQGWSTQALICAPVIGYIATAGIFRWIAGLTNTDLTQSALHVVVYPLEIFELYTTVMIGMLLDILPTAYVPMMWGICVGSIVLLSYCVYEISRWVNERKQDPRAGYPWIQTLILCFLVTASVFGTKTQPSLNQAIPMRMVSVDVEYRLFGFFSHQVRWLDRQLDKLTYQIQSTDTGFEIRHEWSDAVFNLTNIRSIDQFDLTRVSGTYTPAETGSESMESGTLADGSTYVMLPYLHCEQAQTSGITETRPTATNDGLFVSYGFNPLDFLLCTSLSYRDQLIYTTDDPFYLLQAVITSDENWLLLKLSENPYSTSDYLYLVDLRK